MAKIALVFLITFSGGLVLALALGAHWGFYLYQVVYFLNPGQRWWSTSIPNLPYSMIAVVSVLVLLISNFARYNNNKIERIPFIKSLVLLVLSFGLTYFYAIDKNLHSQALIDFIKLVIIMGAAYKVIDTQKKLEYSLLTYVIGAAYIGYRAHALGRNEFGRIEGIGMIDAPDANGAAAALVAALPLLIFYFWKGGKYLRIATVVLGGFIVNGLILINSRGAILGGVVGSAYLLWEMYKAKLKTKHQKMVVVMMVAFGLLAVVSLVDESFMNRVDTLSDIRDEEQSGSHRYRLWIIALEMSKEYPFGTGAYGYEILSPEYVPEHLFDRKGKLKSVHSIWFQVLSEIGWHGLIFFVWVVVSAYFSLRTVKRKCIEENDSYVYYLTQAILAGYIGLLVASSFINQFRVQMIYWMLLYIASLHSIVCLHRSDK